MDSVDFEVLKVAARWNREGRRAVLVTVVRTWGSSPRPTGAMLVVREDGIVVGSVSGGCIEDDLVARVREQGIDDAARPSLLTYGITADEAHRFGLPCGGTIELVVETLTHRSGVAALTSAIEDGRLVTRTLSMRTGGVTIAPADHAAQLRFDGERLVTMHGPRYRMLVIGAGQLSRYLCEIAAGLDYRITVCDPREEYTEAWDIPGTTLVRSMPDDTVCAMKLDSRSAVIALTHDPKLDDLALMEALKTEAFYVGAIGSRRNSEARRERLREFELSEAQLAKLHGPAGVYIGSRTPPEIALSILAEVTAARNGVALPPDLNVGAAKELMVDRTV
jgi:xanthine dehydrogenase accessory factor